MEEPNTRKYAVFQYSYDSSDETNQQQENVQETSTDFPYYPPRGLYLPPDLVLVSFMMLLPCSSKILTFFLFSQRL